MASFANFDGKGMHDLRPKYRREEIVEKGIPDQLELDESLLKNDAGEIDPELVAVETYTMHGFVLEQMWDDMRMRPNLLSKTDDPRIPIGEHFWQDFVDKYCDFDWAAVQRFQLGKKDVLDKVRAKIDSHDENWNLSRDEKNLLRWHYLTSLYSEKGSTSPSTSQFIGIYAHLARVAGDTFQKEFKREPEREEYEHMLADPSFQAMMTQMMMNSHLALNWVVAYLIGVEEATAGVDEIHTNMSRAYHLDCFKVLMRSDGPILQPNKEFFEGMRDALTKWINEQKRLTKQPAKAMRCPVVYTPTFKEMCDWMYHEFSHHYLDQKYA